MRFDVTYKYGHPAAPFPEAVHFHVHHSREEDWSGWEVDGERAVARAKACMAEISSRLGGS